jgi:hypothetical protein
MSTSCSATLSFPTYILARFEALQNPSHDLCKDVFTVALLWFFSILLAKFYREVKYYHGLGSPRLLEKVILPFLDIQESVCYKERYTLLGRDSEGSLIVAP